MTDPWHTQDGVRLLPNEGDLVSSMFYFFMSPNPVYAISINSVIFPINKINKEKIRIQILKSL